MATERELREAIAAALSKNKLNLKIDPSNAQTGQSQLTGNNGLKIPLPDNSLNRIEQDQFL